jgi:cation diffusion facilitator CzcD-associated flavoprotein CzcO
MPTFPNQDEFKGRLIHPQFWDESMDYTNKKVVVIGSGATAVTLVPAIAEEGLACNYVTKIS